MGKREANRRSSIYVGKDGYWHGRVSMGSLGDGSPDRRHVSAKTRKAVTAKVQALEKAREGGSFASSGQAQTVEQWLTHWIENIAAPSIREKSAAAYRTAVYRHLIPGLGKHRLASLRHDHVEAFYRKMAEATVRGPTGDPCSQIPTRDG